MNIPIQIIYIYQKGRKLQLLEIRRLGSDIPEWDMRKVKYSQLWLTNDRLCLGDYS